MASPRTARSGDSGTVQRPTEAPKNAAATTVRKRKEFVPRRRSAAAHKAQVSSSPITVSSNPPVSVGDTPTPSYPLHLCTLLPSTMGNKGPRLNGSLYAFPSWGGSWKRMSELANPHEAKRRVSKPSAAAAAAAAADLRRRTEANPTTAAATTPCSDTPQPSLEHYFARLHSCPYFYSIYPLLAMSQVLMRSQRAEWCFDPKTSATAIRIYEDVQVPGSSSHRLVHVVVLAPLQQAYATTSTAIVDPFTASYTSDDSAVSLTPTRKQRQLLSS